MSIARPISPPVLGVSGLDSAAARRVARGNCGLRGYRMKQAQTAVGGAAAFGVVAAAQLTAELCRLD